MKMEASKVWKAGNNALAVPISNNVAYILPSWKFKTDVGDQMNGFPDLGATKS
jgi:hypothetical protein